MATWSRLTGFREVVDRLRPRLRTSRDERGRELVDLPDAPRPPVDTPTPIRVLPEYDNVLLSHADRSRFIRDDAALLASTGPVHGTVLEDGFVCATWALTRRRDGATSTMTVRHLPLAPGRVGALEEEVERSLRFFEPDAGAHRVVLTPTT